MISLRSETAKMVLNYFYLHPHEELYANELVRKFDVDKRNLVKKLRELEVEGVLKSRPMGNLKLYSINDGYPLYKEYEKIVSKTVGLEKKIRDLLGAVQDVQEAYIFGSYAAQNLETHSDIDLLVVGGHSIVLLQKKIGELQREIDREINVVNMGAREYKKKLARNDPFLKGIFAKKHIRLI